MVTNLGAPESAMPDLVKFSSQKPARKAKRRILSATTLRALTSSPATGSVDYFDDLTPGVSLRVMANDVRTWTVFYRDQHRRQKRLTPGRFPALLLADARELAREAQRKVGNALGYLDQRSADWNGRVHFHGTIGSPLFVVASPPRASPCLQRTQERPHVTAVRSERCAW